MHPRQATICVAVCIGCFCLTAIGLHLALPAPDIAGLTPKLRFIAAHADQIDTLFIGTSRVYHALNPQIFDETTAAAGLPTHSYNFGVNGMSAPETFCVMDQILAAKPRNLRWVFLEFDDLQVTISPDDLRTRRAVYWHDWNRTRLIFRKVLELDVRERWKQKRKRLVRNFDTLISQLGLCIWNFVNLGRGIDLAGFTPAEDDLSQNEYEPNGDGFAPTSTQMDEARARRFEKSLAEDMANAAPRALDGYADQEYRRYARPFAPWGQRRYFSCPPRPCRQFPRNSAAHRRRPSLPSTTPGFTPICFVTCLPLPRGTLDFLAGKYLPLLAITFILAVASLFWRDYRRSHGWPLALTLFVFLYNGAACLEVAIIHSLENPRYTTVQMFFTLLAEFLAAWLVLEFLFSRIRWGRPIQTSAPGE